MKTLYESIIGNTNIGMKAQIEKWCTEHNIFDGRFKINADNTVSCSYPAGILTLHYDDYDELPAYINFKCDKFNVVKICPEKGWQVDTMNKIKSFRGIPDEVHSLKLTLPYKMQSLPPLKIKVAHNFIINATNIKNYESLDIEFIGSNDMCELDLRTDAPLKNIHVKGADIIDFVNDFNIGDAFSKAMNRKAPMNKYKGKYVDPVTNEGLEVINSFFPGIDMSSVKEIKYTQLSKIVKHEGKWYRCKNW